jgi:glucose-1-phosphate thymidylyltransferase
MLAGVREILIVTTPQDADDFKSLLGNGAALGISLSYEVQPKPEGLAQAFIIGEKFIGKDPVALILGDNIFYGPGLGRRLSEISSFGGATIFGVEVREPQRYGVVETSDSGEVLSIEEKPIMPKSNIAVPGLYFFDNTVSNRAKSVTKSARGELEITSVIDSYLRDKKIQLRALESNTAWMDCGTVDSLNEAANFVKSVEQEINFKIGCIEEVAFRQGWIDRVGLKNIAELLGKNEYASYLLAILENSSENVR